MVWNSLGGVVDIQRWTALGHAISILGAVVCGRVLMIGCVAVRCVDVTSFLLVSLALAVGVVAGACAFGFPLVARWDAVGVA